MREQAVCGKCRRPISLAHIYPDTAVDVTDRDFNAQVLGFPGSVFVFFWSPNCGYCRRMLPDVDGLARDYAGRIKFAKVLLDQNPVSGSNYAVQSVPTLIFMKKGRQVDRVMGALPRVELDRYLGRLL
jgi:thioredoxin 2